MNVEIDDNGDALTIESEDRTIHIHQDPAVGDWSVYEVSESTVGQMYVETKQGAISFALGKLGVLDDPDFEHSKQEYT